MREQLRFSWLSPRLNRLAQARGRASVPRMAAAALRIPEHVGQAPLHFVAPGGPQIFIHEGARQALERRLWAAFGGPVQLAVTDNRRRMITHTHVRGTLRVRVHMMFLGAEERVLQALVDY